MAKNVKRILIGLILNFVWIIAEMEIESKIWISNKGIMPQWVNILGYTPLLAIAGTLIYIIVKWNK